MVQDLTQGRIYKGGMAQISVPVFPHCFSPEEVADLVLNFYTEIGGASVEFSGDTITLEGNIATVVFQPVQLEALADGLLRYNVSFSDMVFDHESKYYIKTPNPYTPIEIIDEDRVEEIVDEKIEEKGLISGDEADEKITAETARTEQTYSKIGTFSTFEKLNDYMYYAEYPYLDKAFADEYFRGKAPIVGGGCTSARYGDEYARNFDYYYSNLVEFVVKTKNTIGVAGGNPVLTKAFVEGNNYDDLYKIVPFYLQDGYCMKSGVFANINMVNREESKGTTTYTTPAVEEREQVCSIALVRYILDNFASAAEAVEYIKNYVSIFNPQSIVEGGYELHWMIGDSASTYVLEIVNGEVKYFEQDILSNFYVNGTTANTDGTFYSIADNPDHSPITENGLTPYASGIERYNYVKNNLGTVGLRELFNAIFYSNAYTKAEGEGFWYSEYVGGELGIDNTVAEYEADGRIGRLKAEYEARTRENPTTWHTMHSCVYDFAKKTLKVVSQETDEYVFNFKDLSDYNPTSNFKTINNESIIGQGNIEIQGGGGDSNYLIVNSLDEIENPVEGMKAFVKAQYEDFEGVVITPTQEYEGYAGWMRINEGEEMYSFYYAGEEGNRDWFWDWDNSGQWREREWNGHIIHYQATDTDFNYYFINDTEPYLDLVPENATTAATTFNVLVADAKEYTYVSGSGWVLSKYIIEDNTYQKDLYDLLSKDLTAIDNLYVHMGDRYWKINNIQISNDGKDMRFGAIWVDSYWQDSETMLWHMNPGEGYIFGGYAGKRILAPDNPESFVTLAENGKEGGDWYYYDFSGPQSLWEGFGDSLVHTFDNNYKLKANLYKDSYSFRLMFKVFNDNDESIWQDDYFEWDEREIHYAENDIEFTIKPEHFNDAYKLYSSVELTPEGGLVNTIANEEIEFNDYGFTHIRKQPDLLGLYNGRRLIQYNENDIKEIAQDLIDIETARTESTYVKQEDYQLINVSDLDHGDVMDAVFANPEKFRIIGRNGDLYTYQYSKNNNTWKIFNCDYFGGKNNITMTAHRGYLRVAGVDGYAEEISDHELPIALKTINGQDIKGTGNFSLVENVNGVAGIWQGTQAAYDAIATKDPNTLYVIKD